MPGTDAETIEFEPLYITAKPPRPTDPIQAPEARRTTRTGADRQVSASAEFVADRLRATAIYDEMVSRAGGLRTPERIDAIRQANLPARSRREEQADEAPESDRPEAQPELTKTLEEKDEEEAEAETEEQPSEVETVPTEPQEGGEEESEPTEPADTTTPAGARRREGGEEDEAEGTLELEAISEPDTSRVAMERRTLDLGRTDAPLVMPRYLRIEPREGKRAVPPIARNYERVFLDAVATSERLHRQFMDDGREAAAALASLYGKIEDRAQACLDDTLFDHARTLSNARFDLEQAEEDAISRLAMQADDARRLIRAAAGSAFATVAARKGVIEGRMSLAQDAATDVEDQLVFFVNEVDRAGPPASDAFTALSTDPAPARVPNAVVPYEKHSPEMQAAENEPLDPVVQDRAGDRTTAFAQAQAVFATQLVDAATQFQTAAVNAFQPFQQYVDLLGTPARSRISSLRQSALSQVNKIERKSAQSMRQSRNRVEVALVERYRRGREQLVGTAQRAARSQHGGIERAGEAQLQSYRTAASAQGGVIVALEDEIGKQRENTAEEFAGFVDEASRRTAERARETGRGRRESMGNAARQMRQLTSVRAAAGTNAQERMARQLTDQLTESARRSGAAMMAQILALETSLRRMADPVAASIDQFPIPAATELDTMESELWQKLDQARAQAQAAFYGGTPPPSEEQTENPEAPKPPAGTGSHPNEFVDRSDKFAAEPATEEYIVALTRAVAPKVVGDVERRGDGLIDQMDELEQEPPATLALLRGLTYLRGQAVIKYYNDVRPGNLLDDIGYYMNVGNPASGIDTRVLSIDAAYKYLYGRRAEGALSEIQAAVEFQNNADQVRDAMTSLSAADLEALRGLPGASEIIGDVEEDLGETEGRMFHLLWTATEENARERVAAARSVQLEVRVEEALKIDPERGADRAFDIMEEAAKAAGRTRLEGENEFGLTADNQIETPEEADTRRAASWADTVSRLGRQGERWETGTAGGIGWLRELASRRRVYEQGDRLFVGQTRPEQVRLLTNLAEFGAGAPQTRGAQMVVEETRKGGADPERFERALFDPELNPDMDDPDRDPPKPGDPPSDFERRLARAREREEQAFRFYDEYRNGPREGPPRPVSEIRAELGRRVRAGQSDERQGRLMEMQVVRGLYDPETAALAFEHAVDRWGTDEDLLSRTFSRMSRDQIDTAVGIYDASHTTPLYDRLGIFEHADTYFRELSGDDRIRLQVQAMGNPRNPRERGEVSRMTSRLQLNNAGWAGQFLAGEQYKRLQQGHDRLLGLMGVEDADFDARGRLRVRGPNGERIPVGNFNAKGEFEPIKGEDHSLEFTLLMAHNEHNAAAYQRATDNIANAITTTLVVAAAIISTIATGGAAASIWIPVLVTAGAGLVGMAASWAIKGGRYGYEDAGRDLGMTIVQAATAGIGASLTIARAGGTAALRTALTSRMVSTAGFRSLNILEEAMIAGASGAVGGGGAALFDDRSWDRGQWLTNIGHGFQRGFLGGFIGGVVTGGTTRAIAGAARGVGYAGGALTAASRGRGLEVAGRLGRLRGAAYAQSFPTALAGRTIGGGLGGGASRWAEIEYDRRRGAYRGSSAQAWEEIGSAVTQNTIQSFLEGIAERASDKSPGMRSWRDSIMAGQRPSADLAPAVRLPPEVEEALRPDGEATVPARRTVAEEATSQRGVRPDEAEATARRLAGPDEAEAAVGRLAGQDEAEATARRLAMADEAEAAIGRPVLPDVEEPAVLRSALGPSDDEPMLRSGFDDDPDKTNPEIRIPAPISKFPDGIDLKPGMLETMPHILPETIVQPVNPRDGRQARQNYDLLRTFRPGMEVLLAYNPVTREFMPKQGFPGKVLAPPPPWITLRHSHGAVDSPDPIRQLIAVLPTAFGGDFNALRREIDRMPGAGTSVTVRRSSVIDIVVNGTHVETTFKITRTGDNYSLTVTIKPPVQDVSSLGPFTGDHEVAIREYAYAARDLVGGTHDFGLTKPADSTRDYMSAGVDAPSRVVRNATLSEAERHDAQFVARRMAQAEAFDRQARGTVPRGEFDPIIARAATTGDAHDRVRAMGLVGQPDSLQRLTRLLNSSDPDFTPEMRSALARATLEATRAELISTGGLAPGDELLMLFRGVTGARTDDYERGGIDLSRLGPGGDEDAGRGLYGSQDFASALRYTGQDGQGAVLPLIVRRSELGNVIDVRSGTPLGDRWLAFVRATAREGRMMPTHPHLAGVLDPRFPHPLGLGRGGRGDRFAAFLAMLAADPTLPPAIREAARDPHITLMDLGGVASWGNDRSMLTDQFAMHHQRVADLFNEAHGFPRPGSGEPEGPTMLRSALTPPDGDGTCGATPTKPAPVIPEPETLPHFHRALDLALTPSLRSLEDLVKRSVAGNKLLSEAAITAYVRETDPAARAKLRDAILAQLTALKTPGRDVQAVRHALGRLEDQLLGYLNTPIRESLARLPEIAPSVVASYILEPDLAARATARKTIADQLEAQGMPAKRIAGILRELVALDVQIGGRTREIAGQLHSGQLAGPTAIPANMQRAVAHSPALAVLAARDPKLFAAIAAKYFKKFKVPEAGANAETFFFQKLQAQAKVKEAARVAEATALIAAMEPLRAGLADFRAGLAAAVQDVRGEMDLGESRFATRQDPNFRGRIPLLAVDDIVPGTRVDHYVFGRGTVMHSDGDTIRILLDAPGGGTVEVKLSALDTFPALNVTGERVPPVVPLRDADYQQDAQQDIDRYRKDESLPAYAHETEAGTVSIARAAGEEGVGTNSTLAARTVNLTHEERAELLALFKRLGIDWQDTTRDPRFVHHAELASLIELRGQLRKAGKPMPEVVELFVDRDTCDSCSNNLSVVAAYLGIPELRIYTRGQASGTPPLIIRAR